MTFVVLLLLLVSVIGSFGVNVAVPTRPPPAPAPKSCSHSAQCVTGFACLFPAGSCGFDGSAGTCTKKNLVCPQNYAPVCGCNNRTFSNACMAAAAGISVQYAGACVAMARCYANSQCATGQFCQRPVGSCGGSFANGNCTQQPSFCTLQYAPVCGCDGVTYGNPCAAQSAGVTIASNGACQSAAASCTDNGDCKAKEFCMFDLYTCAGNGTCTATPGSCPNTYLPTCGCDGVSYTNDCLANMNGTTAASFGSC
jgi:hypothetical protein